MPTNDFLPFATAGGANVTAQATYAALAARLTGFQSGVAQSDQVNKAIRQAAFIAACVAQFTNTNSNQVTLDDGDINGFVAKMLTAIQTVGRIRLLAPLSLYVATTGNDTTNTGLTVGSPFLTLQAAANYVQSRLDMNGQAVTINVANGTYSQGVSVFGTEVGSLGARVAFVGNVGSPGSVVVNNGTAPAAFGAYFGALASVSGFTVTATGTSLIYSPTGQGLSALVGGSITFDHMVFGACSSAHLVSDQAGQVSSTGAPYTITGSSPSHASALHAGAIVIANSVVTLTGTPAFATGFVTAVVTGSIDASGCSFSGAATGNRYNVASNGIVNTNGGGASFLPGNATLAPASGGQYL